MDAVPAIIAGDRASCAEGGYVYISSIRDRNSLIMPNLLNHSGKTGSTGAVSGFSQFFIRRDCNTLRIQRQKVRIDKRVCDFDIRALSG